MKSGSTPLANEIQIHWCRLVKNIGVYGASNPMIC